jgi:oligoribonuclease (3'-5' exoribonuclease)
MVKYSCKRCGKEYSQKSHYDSHNRRKPPCENNDNKIKELIDKVVDEKLKELNNKKLIAEHEEKEVIINTTVMKNTGLKRETHDKFYTAPFIVEKCIDLIKKHIDIKKGDICIEPSAGNGSFINSIKALFTKYRFYDLKPENDEIIEQNYLEFDYNTIIKKLNNKIHIIGNPPFGRQSSLAIKFIKKSCEYCDSISFILPKSFKKNSLKKHYPLNFHLICEYNLPKKSFIIDNKEYDVPCVFQIWIKKNIKRILPKKLIPNKYSFVKKTDDNDISFRRVGGNAGHISKKTDDKSIQSHYFIKFDTKLTNVLYSKLKNIIYECKNNTCGPKSISKQELIKEFNKLF